MIDRTAIYAREPMRAALAIAQAAYIDAGGEVQELAGFVHKPLPTPSNPKMPAGMLDANARRHRDKIRRQEAAVRTLHAIEYDGIKIRRTSLEIARIATSRGTKMSRLDVEQTAARLGLELKPTKK